MANVFSSSHALDESKMASVTVKTKKKELLYRVTYITCNGQWRNVRQTVWRINKVILGMNGLSTVKHKRPEVAIEFDFVPNLSEAASQLICKTTTPNSVQVTLQHLIEVWENVKNNSLKKNLSADCQQLATDSQLTVNRQFNTHLLANRHLTDSQCSVCNLSVTCLYQYYHLLISIIQT